MVVFLAFVNGSHYWPVIKWFPPCLTSDPLFAWLGFIPFWVTWIEYLGLIVASSYFSIYQVVGDLIKLHMKFAETYIHLVFLCLWLIVEHGSTLFIYGHESFIFDMLHFCILSNHDSFISYTYVGSTWSLWRWFVYGLVCPRDQFLSDIYLSFRYLCSSLLILDSLLYPYSVVSFIMYFSYHIPL